MSEDEKQRKVDRSRHLLGNYQKKKQYECQRRSEGADVEYKEEKHHLSMTSTVGDKNKMDSPTLQKKTSRFISLNATIQELHDAIAEKDETIDALRIENRNLRPGGGDEASLSERGYEVKMIRERQAMVDARDTYIHQLSDSLKKRSEELAQSMEKEKDLKNEMKNLQLKVKSTLKDNEVKINNSSVELIEYKTKVDVLKSQVKDYAETSKSLKLSLESSNEKIQTLQREILEKDKKMETSKSQTADEIKNLMKLVEELNLTLSKKEKEIIQFRKEVETLQCNMDEQIGIRIEAMRSELEKKYEEDVRKVEGIFDNMLLEHIRTSGTELKSIDRCNELENQIASCRQSYEQEIIRYKEELCILLDKSKKTEEHLIHELDKYKQESDKYKQQVENLKNDLSEEVQKIRGECYLELDKYQLELKTLRTDNIEQMQYYQKEVEQLSEQLQIYALNEATKEIEVETLNHELKKREGVITAKENELEEYKKAFQMQKDQLSKLQSELNRYKDTNSQIQAKLYDFQMIEHKLLHEIKMCNPKIEDYKNQVFSLNEQITLATNNYEQLNQKFQEQVQSLMSTLDKNKVLHKADVKQLTDVINEQQIEISSLQAKMKEHHRENQVTSIGVVTSTKHQNDDDLTSATTNKEFLLGIWNGLTRIQMQIRSLFESNKLELIPHIAASSLSDEYLSNINIKELTLEVENALDNVLDMTQCLQQNGSEHLQSHCLVASTPNIKQLPNAKFTPERADGESTQPDVNSWAIKYSKLEEENVSLRVNLKLSMDNLYEMESCLTAVSQECTLFNKKCQILDGKLSELENSKLSEYLLKKENDVLKQRLKTIEDSEQKLSTEFTILQEDNMNLEKIINKNIAAVLENDDLNSESQSLLTDLKEKSNEIIHLKSQLVSLQKSNKDQQSRIIDIQSEYEYFKAKHNFLTAELNLKTKELEEIWQEKYKLFAKNKSLYRKLTFQTRLPEISNNDTESKNNNTIYSEAANDNTKVVDREITSVPFDVNKSIMNRIESLEFISNTLNLNHSVDNNSLSCSNVSPMDQMNIAKNYWQLQKFDQEGNPLKYHLPTILEEDDIIEENESPY